MGLLARREHSRLELFQKVSKKQFNTDLISENIDDFIEHDWQSDLRYGEMVVRSRILKCHGPVKISRELQQKGISSDIIEDIINIDVDWSELAETALKKRFPSHGESQNEIAKQYRFLLQRGFTNEIIKAALQNF
ncbi:MAG: regulatory protein RecX [Gammaproteobacteria bacterium]|nr:regulatory protein RecX [Gammaproteobacteria bacterium]